MAIIIRRAITRTADADLGTTTIVITLPDGWKQTQQGDTDWHSLVDPNGLRFDAWLEVERPAQAVFRVFPARSEDDPDASKARRRLKALARSSAAAWTRAELIADKGRAAMAIKAEWRDRRGGVDDGRPLLAARRTVAGYDHMAEDDAAPATIGEMT